MKYVIIGGDAAGMSAASAIKKKQPESKVIVMEKGTDVSYGACGMPYKLADTQSSMDELVVVSANTFINKRKIDLRLNNEVIDVDLKGKKVVCKGKGRGKYTESFDKLLIATGASPRRLTVNGAELDGVYYLGNMEDGRALSAQMDKLKGGIVTVVGSSLLGLEIMEALAARGFKVNVIERLQSPLPFLPESFGSRIMDKLSSKNVNTYFGAQLQEIRKTDNNLVVSLKQNQSKQVNLKSDFVVIVAGVEPASKIFLEAGLEAGPAGTIAVDEYLGTSNVDIFAAGDCADAIHGVSGKKVFHPLALRANRAGKFAAYNMMGNKKKVAPIMGTAGAKFFDLALAWTGFSRTSAEVAGFDPVSQEIETSSQAHYMRGAGKINYFLVADSKSKKVLGGGILGPYGTTARQVDTLAAALYHQATLEQCYEYDLLYSPPFGPVWNALHISSAILLKKIKI
jgi:NADPH-dependent 2,4-dienoyl-CoA reductase/sulfur reductase-like enzyme